MTPCRLRAWALSAAPSSVSAFTTAGGARQRPGPRLPTTAAGAAAVGGVAGVGAVALIDAAVQPCRGFHALFGMNHDECVNGVYVGPHRFSELRHRRRYVR